MVTVYDAFIRENCNFSVKNVERGDHSVLHTAHSIRELDFSRLMEIYIEGNLQKAEEGLTLLEAEQDFYQYLREVFFPTPGARYFVWVEEGAYVSALRLEPYGDGWLLEALETAPNHRRKGYGRRLVESVIALSEYERVYSHIHRKNEPSLRLHEACGFRKVLDHGVYIDGSVNRHTVTYCWEKGNRSKL